MWGQPSSAVRRAQPGMHVWRGRPGPRALKATQRFSAAAERSRTACGNLEERRFSAA